MITADEISKVIKLSKQQIISIGVAAGFRGSPKSFGSDCLIVFKLCELLSMSGFNDNDLAAIAKHVSDYLRPDFYKRQMITIVDNKYVAVVPGVTGESAVFFDFKEWETAKMIPVPLLSLTVTVGRLSELARAALSQLQHQRVEVEEPKSPSSTE